MLRERKGGHNALFFFIFPYFLFQRLTAISHSCSFHLCHSPFEKKQRLYVYPCHKCTELLLLDNAFNELVYQLQITKIEFLSINRYSDDESFNMLHI